MTCIEELHQQLGDTVRQHLQVLNTKPAQVKELQARFSHLAANSQAVHDFPLFHPVTVETPVKRLGSLSSRSDGSGQVSTQQVYRPSRPYGHSAVSNALQQ